jgi:hypothetical protein
VIPKLKEPVDLTSRLKEGVALVGDTLFICHASYECRAYGVTDNTLDGFSISQSVVFGTTKSVGCNDQYRKCFHDLIGRLTHVSVCSPHPILVERHELVLMVRLLDAALGDIIRGEINNVVIDASVFPKDRLWVVVDYIQRVSRSTKVFILYMEPVSYSTENGNPGWLSKGVKRLMPIPGFNGRQSAEKKTLLVVIVGHEEERVQITVRNIEPNKVLLIGQSADIYDEGAPRLSNFIVKRLGHDYSHIIDFNERFIAGSRDYLAVRDSISLIYEKYSGQYNIVVAVNSTKLQSLGALIVCRERRAITAVYAEPQVYNTHRTEGFGKIWGVGL